MIRNLFNFKKSPMTRAVYNSEYSRFASRQSLEHVYSALNAHRRGLSEHDVEKRVPPKYLKERIVQVQKKL